MPATPMPDNGDFGGQMISPELKAVMGEITAACGAQAGKLAALFHENIKTFRARLPEAVNAAGPEV